MISIHFLLRFESINVQLHGLSTSEIRRQVYCIHYYFTQKILILRETMVYKDVGIIPTILVTTLVTTAAAAISLYYFQKKKDEKIPTKWKRIGKVKKIYLYPLKSGHSIELERAICTEVGLQLIETNEDVIQLRDRVLIVYSEKDKEYRTARTYPKMMLIDVSVHDKNYLAIDAPTMRTLYVQIPSKSKEGYTKIKLCSNEVVNTLDCGDEAAKWFSNYILEKESGFRLGYNDATERRDITKPYPELLKFYKHLSNLSTGLYHDLSSLHLINEKSVHDMNTRIENSTVTIQSFRPNLTIDGPDILPYAEDGWDWLQIGNVVVRNVKDCTRCVMTTINPSNGVRNSNMEPLRTLKTYRMSEGPEKSPKMGINLEVKCTGIINVGDELSIGISEEH